jgi:hypothetical protein
MWKIQDVNLYFSKRIFNKNLRIGIVTQKHFSPDVNYTSYKYKKFLMENFRNFN